MAKAENLTYRVDPDGFYGELFVPEKDNYPKKALICFSGSDGGIELARTLAGVLKEQNWRLSPEAFCRDWSMR